MRARRIPSLIRRVSFGARTRRLGVIGRLTAGGRRAGLFLDQRPPAAPRGGLRSEACRPRFRPVSWRRSTSAALRSVKEQAEAEHSAGVFRPRPPPAAPSAGGAGARRRRSATSSWRSSWIRPARGRARGAHPPACPRPRRQLLDKASLSSRNGTPRKMTSGSAATAPSSTETVATTMTRPSAESVTAVAQGGVVGVADVDPVDEDHPASIVIAEAGAVGRRSRAGCRCAPGRSVCGRPRPTRRARVQAQPLVVAVHRHHIARPGQVEHQLHVLLIAVAGGVDRRVGGGDHPGADLEDPVDRLVDRLARCRAPASPRRRPCRRSGARRRGGRRGPSAAAPRAARPGCRSRSRPPPRPGSPRSRCGWISSPSGACAIPRLEAMLKFLRIERPTRATLRPRARPHRRPAGRGGRWRRSR